MISLLSSTVKELGQRKNERSEHRSISHDKDLNFLQNLAGGSSAFGDLPQVRYQYNMEGHFSPHLLPDSRSSGDFIWIEDFFIQSTDSKTWAVSARKLLEIYTAKRLQMMAATIPLLVSEPFPSKGIKKETLQTLLTSGLELEALGSDTVVVRGIPDWMNGYPLREIVNCLLHQKNFAEVQINPSDWSQSTWLEMLEYFTLEELLTKKIIIDLPSLLREKLK
jgi:hypothetical protein